MAAACVYGCCRKEARGGKSAVPCQLAMREQQGDPVPCAEPDSLARLVPSGPGLETHLRKGVPKGDIRPKLLYNACVSLRGKEQASRVTHYWQCRDHRIVCLASMQACKHGQIDDGGGTHWPAAG